jgi:Tol biopolymer transport system component
VNESKRGTKEVMIRIPLALLTALALFGSACAGADKDVLNVKNGPIAANWQGEGIYLIDPATSERHRIPRTEQATAIAWSPDGRSLAFVRAGKVQGSDVYTIRADGSDVRLVLKNAHDPDWSPDGKRLLIVRDVCTDYYSDCIVDDSRVDLYTVRPDGKELRHVAREPNGALAAWSADGKRLAFLANDGDVYLIDADGDHRHLLGGKFFDLAWSPDGSMLAVAIQSRAPNWGDIGLVDVATGRLTNLTQRPGQESSPAWSPDGRKIVFVADMYCGWTGTCQPEPGAEGGPRELWVMDRNGGHLRQLTRNGGLGYDRPAWQPLLESPKAND